MSAKVDLEKARDFWASFYQLLELKGIKVGDKMPQVIYLIIRDLDPIAIGLHEVTWEIPQRDLLLLLADATGLNREETAGLMMLAGYPPLTEAETTKGDLLERVIALEEKIKKLDFALKYHTGS